MAIVFACFILNYSAVAFEVKGVAVTTTLCEKGKCTSDPNNDEVIYEIDSEHSMIIRKAVINKSIKEGTLSGLQSDNTVYKIVYDNMDSSTRTLFKQQRMIKAIGQTALSDGFETIVIGEDFVHTSRSSDHYFVIYYYKRVRTLP
jgi:hypothetical protein